MTKETAKEKLAPNQLLAIKEVRDGNLRHGNIGYAVGVTDDTITNWLKNSDFSERFYKAKMAYRKELLDKVKRFRSDTLLTKQFKDEFGEESKVDVDVTFKVKRGDE